MKLSRAFLILSAVAATAAVVFAAQTQTLTLTLPQGNPAAGRQAFLDLSCTSCHRVVGDPGLPLPVSANPGPFLGGALANREPGWLATSIVTPSHDIHRDIAKRLEGELSPMGDFSHAMTLRQLTDLIAYLRSVPERPAPAG